MKELGTWTLKTTKKLFELDEPIDGYKYALVSVKADGVDFLSASVFAWLTHDTEPEFSIGPEIYFDCGEDVYNHTEELEKALKKLTREEKE